MTDSSVRGLGAAFRDGSLSPVEVVTECLTRIEEVNPLVNAFCHLDPDHSIAAARESEDRHRRGEPLGPLDGVPVAVKDLLLTAGWPTRRGSRSVPAEGDWTRDAPVVARLRTHGAVLLGKTTTPEFGWKGVTDSPLTGITRNPHDLAKTAGGSSGGSAVAVATGMALLAIGTDGGGSIRIPSSFCGVVGLKPTLGLVPVWPPSAFGALSHVGPHARTAEDAAILLSAIAGPSEQDVYSVAASTYVPFEMYDLDGLRVGFSPDLGRVRVQEDVADQVAAAVGAMAHAGARVEVVDPGFADPIRCFETLWYAGAARVRHGLGPVPDDILDPGFVEVADLGARLRADEYVEAMESRAALAAHVEELFRSWDVLVTPTMPIDAFDAGLEVPPGWTTRRWMSWTPFTYPFNITGNPAISVPCGTSAAGLPVGLQIVGRRGGDDLVLRVAAAYGGLRS